MTDAFDNEIEVLDHGVAKFVIGGVAFTFDSYHHRANFYEFVSDNTIHTKVRVIALSDEQHRFLHGAFDTHGHPKDDWGGLGEAYQ